MVDSPKIFHGNNFTLYIFGVVIPMLIFKTIFPVWQLRLGNLVTIREANLSFYRL